MPKLHDWLASPKTKAVVIDSSLVPKMYVSTVGLTSSELSAVAAKEVADGWPAAVVDRATTRRQAKMRLYVGPKGLSIGDVPSEDIAPGLAKLSRVIRQPVGVRFWRKPAASNDSVVSRVRALYTDNWATDSACVGFIKNWLIRDPALSTLAVVYSSYINSGNPEVGQTAFFDACQADNDDQYLHVGFTVKAGVGGSGNTSDGRTTVVVRFEKGGWHGVRGIWFGPQYSGSALIANTSPNDRGWAISMIVADQGFSEYVNIWRPGLAVRVATTRPTGILTTSANMTSWSHLDVLEHGLSPVEAVGWWQRSRSLFEQRHNVWKQDVYGIGTPEFVNRFTVVGDSTDGYQTVTGALLGFEWDGARLADMYPAMSSHDKDQVSSLLISTVVHREKVAPACSLTDLYVEQLHQENGMTVADKVFKDAVTQGTERYPAMTFAEAVARANEIDDTVWHRQIIAKDTLDEVDLVRLTGTTDATVVTCYSGSTVVSTDPDAGLVAFMLGAECDVSTWVPGLTADPFMEAWGINQYDITHSTDKLRIKLEFDEAYVYGHGLPFRSKLTRGSRTAMLMHHAAMSRKQFSSFVVGSALMASNARKLLT